MVYTFGESPHVSTAATNRRLPDLTRTLGVDQHMGSEV